MRFLICAVALVGSSTSVFALTDKQEGVLNNLANAMAADAACSTLQLNTEFARIASRFHDVDLDDPAIDSELQRRIANASKKLQGETEDTLCRAGLAYFGPEGTTVPNLLLEGEAVAEQAAPSEQSTPAGQPAPSSKKLSPGASPTEAGSSDLDRVVAILQDMGYRAVPDGSSSPPEIASKFGGINTNIQLANCDEGTTTNCGILRFHAGFDLTEGLDAKAVNQWNLDKYFGRAYLDEDNDPHVDLVVSMVGISDESIKDHVEWWEWAIGAFKGHIDW